MFQNLYQKAQDARTLLTEGKLHEAKTLALQIESEADNSDDETRRRACQFYASTLLTDIGNQLKDKGMISRGIEYLENRKEQEVPERLGNLYFNLANGYYYLTEVESNSSIKFIDTENARLARRHFRLAAKEQEQAGAAEYWTTAFWINYGNLLGDNGRIIEAADAYDEAIRLNPNMGMALGNKATLFCQLANALSAYSIPLLLEAVHLFQAALAQTDVPNDAHTGFAHGLEIVQTALNSRNLPQTPMFGGIEPKDEFQSHLCNFLSKHNLYLSPVSSVGEHRRPFFGDPMFFLGVPHDEHDDMKLNRYISLLNELKNDFALGRYFLFQSQYRSNIMDAVDDGVGYFRTYDGAQYGIYVQLLKSALKQAVDVLDKVAYFIYDYCRLSKPTPDKVSFRTIWGDVNSGKLKKAFAEYENEYLFALFTLARDLSKAGDWEWLMESRGIVTHRFMILHESSMDGKAYGEIPHRSIEDFRSDTLFALKMARAAMMYLILFVDEHGRLWSRANPAGCMAAIGAKQLQQLLVSFLNAD